MYMRYAQGFLLVFSITSTTSLAELGELPLRVRDRPRDFTREGDPGRASEAGGVVGAVIG